MSGRECDYCHGEGVRFIHDEDGLVTSVTCGKCNGSGQS